MIVLIHVLIALASIGVSGYTFFSPSNSKLKLSYVFVVGTLVSGTYLVISTKAHLISACLTGLLYLGTVLTAIALARNKLATDSPALKE